MEKEPDTWLPESYCQTLSQNLLESWSHSIFLHCGSLYFYQILLLPFAIVKIAELE